MRRMKWTVLPLILIGCMGASAPVTNYFPPPGISYTQTGGLALGGTTQQGTGTLNALNLYINGVAVTPGAGTVTSVSVVSANGLSGSVATPTTTPAITLSPTFTGIAYSNGTGIAAAIASNFPTLNQNTTGNAATATTATTASALAATPTTCSAGQAAGGVLANGNATGCLTPYSVVNESANTFFAGPASGTAALPTFRAMVGADMPVSASLTWTGNYTFNPASGVGITINGTSGGAGIVVNNGLGQYSEVIGSSTTGSSFGLAVIAGTNSSDAAFVVQNRAQTSNYLQVLGDGGSIFGVPTGGDEGIGTVNAQTLYNNGVPVQATGTITATITTGCTTTPSANINYTQTAHTVTLQLPNVTCTGDGVHSSLSFGNSSTFPAALRPANGADVPVYMTVNGSNVIGVCAVPASGGTFTCFGFSGTLTATSQGFPNAGVQLTYAF